MGKISGIGLAFMLFASLGFSTWISGIDYPSCLTTQSVLNVSFTTSTANSVLACTISQPLLPNYTSTGETSISNTPSSAGNVLSVIGQVVRIGGDGSYSCTYTGATDTNYTLNANGTYNGTLSFSVSAGATPDHGYGTANITNGSSSILFNLTTFGSQSQSLTIIKNGATTTVSNGTTNITFGTSIRLQQSGHAQGNGGYGSGCSATISLTLTTTPQGMGYSSTTEINSTTNTTLYTTPYISFFDTGVLRSDFKSGRTIQNNASLFCRSLLYFNNPYYGNIQLIPKITYIPGVDAFPNFINTSDNSAYIPNNTITYVFDSVTSIWYIVPATICASFSTVGSTTTLQYNPTATGTAQGGTVPIDVTGITGSCSYATATRIITCTGTDTSNTVTSLTLSAYLTGNTTDLCGSTVAGASGTLTCTLPAQNGTYNVIFYGSDADLFLHSFASKTIVIGTGSSGYGRDAYIAVFLLVGVAALLLSSNIAVSMVLMCFGLFVALAVGALPISDAPVVVFFTVIALVLAYRLKV